MFVCSLSILQHSQDGRNCSWDPVQRAVPQLLKPAVLEREPRAEHEAAMERAPGPRVDDCPPQTHASCSPPNSQAAIAPSPEGY